MLLVYTGFKHLPEKITMYNLNLIFKILIIIVLLAITLLRFKNITLIIKNSIHNSKENDWFSICFHNQADTISCWYSITESKIIIILSWISLKLSICYHMLSFILIFLLLC